MPLQNRVDPWGRLHAVADRGTLTGNRGILHNQSREVVAQWRTKAWITCQLEWKGWRRTVMRPGSWTELFFLDEITAFAAGHRPCAYCRRARFNEFKATWIAANLTALANETPRVAEIDAILHAERTGRGGEKVTYESDVRTLPNGTMITVEDQAYAVWNRQLLRWSFSGYSQSEELGLSSQWVQVLTPASIVRTFRAGFRPVIHLSR